MNAPQRLTVLASGLVCAGVIAAGCGSKPAASTTHAPAQAPPPLATSSAVTTGAAWTVVQMGGPAAQHENFWELFVRPAGTARWRLATPAGVADNGGLVVTAAGRVAADRVPAQPGPDLLPARGQQRQRGQLVARRAR